MKRIKTMDILPGYIYWLLRMGSLQYINQASYPSTIMPTYILQILLKSDTRNMAFRCWVGHLAVPIEILLRMY